MAEVFSSSFAAEQHTAWVASQYAWDPCQLQALPLAGSPASGSTCAFSEHVSEGPCSSTGAQRDQSLGPVPLGWQDFTRPGTGVGTAGGKEMRGAHTRAPKGPLVCQVEGCGHDLSLEKGYYQRYRVCEPHMKLLSLVVNGKACRFCQQCGRFQELTEFDGNKRSCRARLLQHNARRRKRDPLETSRKDVSRKGKSHHPWSDSSNDADMVHSGDLSNGMSGHDKVMTNGSLDSGDDQGAKLRPSVAPLSSSGLPTWNAIMCGSMDTTADVIQQQVMLQQPMAAQVPSALIDTELARCFSGGTDDVDALDEMLDGILDNSNEYMEGSRLVLQPPISALPAGIGAMGAFGTGAAGTPVGFFSASLSDVRPQSTQFGVMSMAMDVSPPISGSMVASGSMPQSLPTSAVWPPSSMGLDGVGSDISAALNKRATQQRQLQEHHLFQQLQQQQMQQQQQLQQKQQIQQKLLQQKQLAQQQHLQQQLLQQQQQLGGVMARPVASLSVMQPETFMTKTSSTVASGFEGGLGGGFVGPLNSHNALHRGVAPPWGAVTAGNAISVPGVLSGGLSLNSNVSHASVAISGVANGITSGPVVTPQPSSATSAASSSFDLARRLVSSGGAAAQYQSEDLLVRVSIKIANCTPDQLPVDLYQRLQNLLNTADASLVQGFLRPGCTHLIMDVQVDSARKGGDALGCHFDDDTPTEAGGLGLSARDLRGVLGVAVAHCAVLVQTDCEVAMWSACAPLGAEPQRSASLDDLATGGELPVIHHVSTAAHIDARGHATLLIYGVGLHRPGVEISARIQGGYVSVAVTALVQSGRLVKAVGTDPKLAAITARALLYNKGLQRLGRKCEDVLLLDVGGVPGTGLLILEAQTGPLLGNWRPCLLSTDAAIASELSAFTGRALRAGADALTCLEAFIVDLGRVLDQRSYSAAARIPAWGTDGIHSGRKYVDETAANLEEVVDLSEVQEAEDTNEVTLALVCVCERLLATATDLGMARISTFLVGALWQYGQDVQAIMEAPYADGLSIAHRCVRSGNPVVLRSLLAWVQMTGAEVDLTNAGALGLSPLHLAALVPSTWLFLASNSTAYKSWHTARAPADGATPVQLQQMLLAMLPRGALPQEVVEVFAPKPRPVMMNAGQPASAGATSTEARDEYQAQLRLEASHASEASEAQVYYSNASVSPGKSRGALTLMAAMIVFSVVVAMASSRLWGPKVVGDAQGGPNPLALITEHRLLGNCCSTVLYLSLLGLAIFLLPLNSAATLLSQFHPSSTCIAP